MRTGREAVLYAIAENSLKFTEGMDSEELQVILDDVREFEEFTAYDNDGNDLNLWQEAVSILEARIEQAREAEASA